MEDFSTEEEDRRSVEVSRAELQRRCAANSEKLKQIQEERKRLKLLLSLADTELQRIDDTRFLRTLSDDTIDALRQVCADFACDVAKREPWMFGPGDRASRRLYNWSDKAVRLRLLLGCEDST